MGDGPLIVFGDGENLKLLGWLYELLTEVVEGVVTSAHEFPNLPPTAEASLKSEMKVYGASYEIRTMAATLPN